MINHLTMNKRVQQLRKKTIAAVNVLNHERALLLTDFYREKLPEGTPVPVQRALSFKYIMEHKKLYIGDQELIVGERGPEPKAAST